MKITTIDIETTGLPPKNARYETYFMDFPHILSMAWKINDQSRFEYIINQEGRIVPPEATKINGITQEMCDSSKFNTFTVLLQFMMDADQSDWIIGHNIYFDTSVIKANILRIISGGITPMAMFDKISDILHKDKRIDTMRLCAKLFGGKWPTLSEAHKGLFGTVPDISHSAGADVDTTYNIYLELVKRGVVAQSMIRLPPGPIVIVEEE